MREDVPGLDLDRALQMVDRLVRPPTVEQGGAEIVEPFHIVRVTREEDLEMPERAPIVPEHRVGVSEMLMDLHVVGPERLNALELGLGQIELTAIRVEDAKIAVTDRAAGIGLERVPPERLCVAPDLNLVGAQIGQTAEPDDAERGHGLCESRAKHTGHTGLDRGTGDGADEEGEAESREVAVPIVGQLVSRMNDADHRAQRNRVVRPDRQPGRPAPPERENRDGDRGHGNRGDQELPIEEAYLRGKLVERRESLRHYGLFEIEPEAVEDHGGPRGQGIPLERRDERVHFLGGVGDDGAGHAENHEGNLLQPYRAGCPAGPPLPAAAEAAERVDVQYHEGGRQHHHACLRDERQDERAHRPGEQPPAARAAVVSLEIQ